MLYVAFVVQAASIAKIGTGEGTKFEYPFLIGVVAIAFVIMGPGPWTLPRLLRRR